MPSEALRSGQQVIKEEAGPEHERTAVVPLLITINGNHERNGVDEVTRETTENCSLVESFAYETEFELLQVTQTSMNQFCGTARRTGSEVARFNEASSKPSPCAIKQESRSSNPSANDQDIKPLSRH